MPVLDVELAVEASDATDMRSRSAGSVSDESPTRARLSRDVLVGLGLGTQAALAAPEEAEACGVLPRLGLEPAPVAVAPVWPRVCELLDSYVEVG